MPAAAQSSLDKSVKKLGVFAGGGDLPARLVQACESKGIDIFIVGFENQTNGDLYEGRNHMSTRIGAAGKIIDTLRLHGIKDIVMIGSVRRPGMAELRPDFRTAQFFTKVGLRALGDDGLLKALKDELGKEGFCIHGAQDFIDDLIGKAGILGRCKPKKSDMADIERGFEVLHFLGPADVGQSVIIQEGLVLGIEAAEGTDELLRRCASYRRKGSGGILVKVSKPGQDMDLDLPTIGPETVRLCAEYGYDGIAFEAGRTLVIDTPEISALADTNKIFVAGIDD